MHRPDALAMKKQLQFPARRPHLKNKAGSQRYEVACASRVWHPLRRFK
jgi:hypothetical protein